MTRIYYPVSTKLDKAGRLYLLQHEEAVDVAVTSAEVLALGPSRPELLALTEHFR